MYLNLILYTVVYVVARIVLLSESEPWAPIVLCMLNVHR
jgi:hypothetical protein